MKKPVTEEQRQAFIAKQKETFSKRAPNLVSQWTEMFMPKNGKCWHCNGDIIEDELKNGNDGSELVTGCPYCFRTYCD